MSSESSAWRYGLWVTGLVAVVWLAGFRFPAIWVATGIGEANRPFMDLYGILAACDARLAGVNPYLPNDFDPYHRPHVYSEWWLELSRLGLGRSDTLWLGYTLLAVVLITTVIMANPRNRREGMGMVLLLVSPAFLLAVNRANNDLVVFVIVSLGLLCFRAGLWPWRALGIVLFSASAVLKYTPLVTLVVLLDLRTRRDLVAGLGLYSLVLVLAWPGLTTGLSHLTQFMPGPEWLYAFGAPVFLRDLGITSGWGWQLPAGLLLAWAVWCAGRKWSEAEQDLSPLRDAAEREFICGAAMLVGLFLTGSSYVYKLIFALWLLPWLWKNCGGGDADAAWGRATGRLMLAVAWLEGGMALVLNLLVGPWSQSVAQHVLQATLLTTQLLTWALVACLLRFLASYVGRRGRALWVNG